MTIEELKGLTGRTMQRGITSIRESGSLAQQFTLLRRDGGLDLMMMDGTVTNDENAKSALAKLLRERIAAGEIEAVIHLSDTFFARITPENQKIKDALRMNVEEAAAFGLCEKAESVICSLESPLLYYFMRQEYRRDGGKITLVGEPQIASDADGELRMLRGRFTGLFPRIMQGRG